jgi:hypothetical protein
MDGKNWVLYLTLNTVRLRGKDITLAPLAPQFWGEMTLVFGFLPSELGGLMQGSKDLTEQY